MQRATRKPQKAQRRQEIMTAAWELFQHQPYEAVNMNDVAQQVGVAKGTLYLYFETKESLFLAILHEQFEQWFGVVDERLVAHPAPISTAALADLLAVALAERPSLTRLFALLHLILEQNSQYGAVLAFKRMLRERVGGTAVLIEQAMPFMAAGQGATFLLNVYALLLGIQQLANPAPTAEAVLAAEPGMEIFRIPFQPTLAAVILTLLEGMKAQKDGGLETRD